LLKDAPLLRIDDQGPLEASLEPAPQLHQQGNGLPILTRFDLHLKHESLHGRRRWELFLQELLFVVQAFRFIACQSMSRLAAKQIQERIKMGSNSDCEIGVPHRVETIPHFVLAKNLVQRFLGHRDNNARALVLGFVKETTKIDYPPLPVVAHVIWVMWPPIKSSKRQDDFAAKKFPAFWTLLID
jgi:hypothetical protein